MIISKFSNHTVSRRQNFRIDEIESTSRQQYRCGSNDEVCL